LSALKRERGAESGQNRGTQKRQNYTRSLSPPLSSHCFNSCVVQSRHHTRMGHFHALSMGGTLVMTSEIGRWNAVLSVLNRLLFVATPLSLFIACPPSPAYRTRGKHRWKSTGFIYQWEQSERPRERERERERGREVGGHEMSITKSSLQQTKCKDRLHRGTTETERD
jgi:hypothetical protein